MADTKLTDDQVANLAAILRSDTATPDAKVQYVTTIKSGIKQHHVPDTCVPQLFDGLRAASASQHAALANAGFTALNHLFTRMSRQEPKFLAKEAARTLPLVIEKLGDQKDKFRSLAMQALNTIYGVAPAEVERWIRNTAMVGKSSRAKEASMHWLLQTHQEQGLPFRSYVPSLMDLLEDADGMVRDTAKSTVIELFKNAPNAAKSDLKRQLKNCKVRPAIEQAIVKALAPTPSRPDTPSAPLEVAPPPPTRPTLSTNSSTISTERPVTPMTDIPAETVEPMYINTNRELDDIIKDMVCHFEGKESEQNWMKREQSIVTLRRLIVGNAAADFHDTFIAGLRTLLDGIIKAVNSLRTSLSKEGCSLVQEIATTFGPSMDPLVELLMQTFMKLSANTKKISSQMANAAIDTMLSKITYTPRLMQHVWGACQDKNVQPRLYSSGWIKTILKKEAHHKNHIEHTGGVDLMEKCIKKALADPNPGVREKMRSTYWAFWGVWPARADAIMADLESTAQKLLNKDPSNPNSSNKPEASARPGAGLSKSTMSTSSRPSLREAMLAQKKAAALATKNLPVRPGSAMSSFSPVRTTTPGLPTQPTTTTTTTTTSASTTAPAKPPTRSRQESSISVNAGGMSVAPMRPARRRPDVARPATAGPYSVRDQPCSMEADSPEDHGIKTAAPKLKDTTPQRATSRPRLGHASHASESSVISPAAKPPAPTGIPSPSAKQLLPSGIPSPSAKHSVVPTSIPSPTAKHHTGLTGIPSPTTKYSVPSGISSPTSKYSISSGIPSPRGSPARPRYSQPVLPPSSPSKGNEDLTLVVPILSAMKAAPPRPAETPRPSTVAQPTPVRQEMMLEPRAETPGQTLKVYEDPFTDDQDTPKSAPVTGPVLEEKPVNEDAANVPRPISQPPTSDEPDSPEKTRQNSRLLDSGINKIKAKSLEVHGFRKLQSLIRDSKTAFTDQRFEALLVGLFQYLEDPLADLPADKAQDVKAQILTTIKLLLKKERDNFQPHVSKGLESLLQTRGRYDTRAHVVSGLELLADELVTIGDGSETVVVLTKRLQNCSDTTTEGCRTLSMGLHVLKEMLDKRKEFVPSRNELAQLTGLAGRCLDSMDSGVRMDAVKFCVALHARVGDASFWEALAGVKDDPKSLITYYIVKKQREEGIVSP